MTNKDSGLCITALVTRIRTDVEHLNAKVEYNVKKAMAEELIALSKVIDTEDDMTNEELNAALNDAGVMVSMAGSQMGTLNVKVAQYEAKAAKEVERNMKLANRLTVAETKCALLETTVNAIRNIVTRAEEVTDEVDEL